MRLSPIALALVLPLCGCSDAQLERFTGLVDSAETVIQRVNQGIERADVAAKQLCPQLELIGVTADTLTCVANASGIKRTRLAQIAKYRTAFCENPTAKGAAELASFIAEGVRAARAATAAGCSTQ